MNKRTTRIALSAGLLGLGAIAFSACSDADTVSKNLSTAADNFEVARQIVVYNSFTDKYVLEVEGYCSLGNGEDEKPYVSYTCEAKDMPGGYFKDIIERSDNTFVFG